jgi:hypothetical protein
MRRFFIHRARTGGRTHRRLSFGMALFFELLRDWKKPGTDSVKGRLLLVSVKGWSGPSWESSSSRADCPSPRGCRSSKIADLFFVNH